MQNRGYTADMHGINRNLLIKINKLLTMFPVVCILGARQVGKTTLAKIVSSSNNWQYWDLENPEHYAIISSDPCYFFQQNPHHIILDEVQINPQLLQVLRGVIDNQREVNGRFILTGSSSPELLKQATDSLAGRIAIVELGTLKANEYYQKPLSIFYEIFAANKLERVGLDNLVAKQPPMSTTEMQYCWLKGGYPKAILATSQQEYDLWMHNYRDTYVNRDIASLFPKLNKHVYQRLISMLSSLSGTIVNKRDLSRSLEVSETTVREYLQIANGTFLWRNIASFEKSVVKAVIKMPKGYLRDTGLLHFLHKIKDSQQLYLTPIIGCSFEGFVIEELIKGLQSTLITNWDVYYYRTRNGAEIDCVIHGTFGILPIEVKYGTIVSRKQLRSLEQFVLQNGLPYGIVINNTSKALWLTENIFVMPVGWL